MKTLDDFIGQEISIQLTALGLGAGFFRGKLTKDYGVGYTLTINKDNYLCFLTALLNQDYYKNTGHPMFIVAPQVLIDEIKKHWER